MPEDAAAGASLDQQLVLFCPVEEEPIVLRQRRPGTQGATGWRRGPGRLGRGWLGAGLPGAGRRCARQAWLELEDPEQHGGHLVALLIDELQTGGDEVAYPEASRLLR